MHFDFKLKTNDIVLVCNNWSCQTIFKSHHAGHSFGPDTNWFLTEAYEQSKSANFYLVLWTSNMTLTWDTWYYDNNLCHIILKSYHTGQGKGPHTTRDIFVYAQSLRAGCPSPSNKARGSWRHHIVFSWWLFVQNNFEIPLWKKNMDRTRVCATLTIMLATWFLHATHCYVMMIIYVNIILKSHHEGKS